MNELKTGAILKGSWNYEDIKIKYCIFEQQRNGDFFLNILVDNKLIRSPTYAPIIFLDWEIILGYVSSKERYEHTLRMLHGMDEMSRQNKISTFYGGTNPND